MTPSPISLAIVDDSIVLQKILRTYLSGQGFDIVIQAYNGLEFLQQMSCTGELPQLCLLDINMPVMDGYETAMKLKDRYPSVKILAYSFLCDSTRVDRIIECGASNFVCKDIEPAVLRAALLDVFMSTTESVEHYSLAITG